MGPGRRDGTEDRIVFKFASGMRTLLKVEGSEGTPAIRSDWLSLPLLWPLSGTGRILVHTGDTQVRVNRGPEVRTRWVRSWGASP